MPGHWPPGTALWLVWQMTDSTGKAQGLGIDNVAIDIDGDEKLSREIWLLTHPDLRRLARVSIVLDWLEEIFGRAQRLG